MSGSTSVLKPGINGFLNSDSTPVIPSTPYSRKHTSPHLVLDDMLKSWYRYRRHRSKGCQTRVNILEATNWAVPFGPITIKKSDRFFIRTREDQELVSDQWTIKSLAEGATWTETMRGRRLPVSVIAKMPSVYAKKCLPFVDAESWRGSDPRISCAFWRKERDWRTRLLEGE